MSEVTSRSGASRGRGSSRGGRGGFSNRGGRSAATKSNGDAIDSTDTPLPSAFEEDGDIAQLRKLYGSKVALIKDMFPGWSDVDVLYALQEADGDENLAVERIAHGAVAQWGEVSKPKKSSRVKKDSTTASTVPDSHSGHRAPRGGRNIAEGGRGRGRGADRGGRAPRGRTVPPPTNGARKDHALSVPTEESTAWDITKNDDVADVENRQPNDNVEEQVAAPEPATSAAAPAKTWASMLRQATAPKQAPKPKEPSIQKPAETLEPLPPAELLESKEPAPPPEAEPEPAETPVSEETSTPTIDNAEPATEQPHSPDQLTASNLDQVDDTSGPAPTGTAASTAADSWAPAAQTEAAIPTPAPVAQPATQPAPAVPTTGAFGTPKSAAARPQHIQRRILDQEEAVRMPGNREVDRAAVQFGAFSLNGAGEDVDGDREEPETRAQPPVESPIAHPRTSLPPVGQPHVPEAQVQQKAPLPAMPTAAPTAPASQAHTQPAQSQPPSQTTQSFGRFGGQAGAQEGAPGFSLGQQGANAASTQQQFDNFPSQHQSSQLPHSASGFSSAPGDFSSYYTADQHNRAPYNYYGQQYGQQQQQQQQQQQSQAQPEAAGAAAQQQQPQRSFSGYNNPAQSDNLSQYPQSGVGSLHNQSRFGGVATDPQSSGHTTPNPPTQGQAQQQPAGQGSQPQPHGQQNYPGYGTHPYYGHPYYHQYFQSYNQGAYGGAPYGKGGVYGSPYAPPYEHGSSPAGGFQSSVHRENNGIASSLDSYGRVGTSQAGHQAGMGGSSFGGMHDTFGRGPSSFQSQAGQGFNAQSQTGGTASANDDLKPYADPKSTTGPSPSLGGARPGSAANNTPAGQSGLPPQSNAQMGGYGGYPSHGLHGSSSYGNTGAQHGNAGYGSYNQGNAFPYYGAGGAQQQGQQQQRGGWGGNYNH